MYSLPSAGLGRTALIALAILGVLYMLMQAQPAQTTVSGWRGVPVGAAGIPAGAISGSATIVGDAAAQGGLNPDAVTDQNIPTGNPLRSPRTVLTQGYGVGSHAPADTWGGVDLALDSDGNGHADPWGTQGAPVYATHGGTAEVHPDSWPGGNCVLLRSEGYRTTYCHLRGFAISNGVQVRRGDQIGSVGSTGNSSGPHLHYEVWVGGVNRNPLDFGAMDGAGQ
ncbi:MAG: hypothetical protein RLZZ387_4281 [Chloroflexota bacterium]|jgi:murein DD-endopeptidase MepM/ murein hydrolase activator NlpD